MHTNNLSQENHKQRNINQKSISNNPTQNHTYKINTKLSAELSTQKGIKQDTKKESINKYRPCMNELLSKVKTLKGIKLSNRYKDIA